MHMTNSKNSPASLCKNSPFLFSLFLLQACHDRGWISAAAAAAPLPTCGVRSACCASRSAAWWRQTLSTWWCSVWWLSTPSVWPLSTTTNPTGSPSSSVGFFCECLCCLLFFFNQKKWNQVRKYLLSGCTLLHSAFWLLLFHPCLISRLCRVCFPGAVSGWDVFENVWSGFPAVLPLIFQLLRLWGEVLHLLFSLCARIYAFLVLNED